MTIYEMNKEQIIDTVKNVADKCGVKVSGLWTDLKHPYRRTIIFVTGCDWRVISRALDPVINGLKSINGEELVSAQEKYSSGYESCELTVVNSEDRFNKLLLMNKGVNWVE